MAGQRTKTSISEAGTAGAGAGRPGERLGLPAEGAGSIAGFPRRIAALVIDWLVCMAIAQGLLHWSPLATFGLFALENLLLVSTVGRTLGMRLLGIGVISASGGHRRPLMVLVRTVLLCTAIPAAIWDSDQRGMHDRASDTVVVRG